MKQAIAPCPCDDLESPGSISMRGEGLDLRFFATMETLATFGQNKWWLYASQCIACGQQWLIAQDERIYDEYVVAKLDSGTVSAIVERGEWPLLLGTYEEVLRFAKNLSGASFRFEDPLCSALVWTAHDLREERPSITILEIAELLQTSERLVEKLLKIKR